MKNPILRLGAALLVLALAGTLAADTVYFNDGGRVRGRIIAENDREVVLETAHGRVTVERNRISRIERERTALDDFAQRHAALPAGDAEARFALALWCREARLYKQADDVFHEVIEIAPDHEGARRELGYERVEGRWVKRNEGQPLFPGGTPRPSATSRPTPTLRPSATSRPTPTLRPSATPRPTPTRRPSATPRPTPTRRPSATPRPTPTRRPSATARPSGQATPREGFEPYQGRLIPAAEAERIRERQQWDFHWTLESEHWRCETNVGRAEGQEWLAWLEAFREAFCRELAGGPPGLIIQRPGEKLAFSVFRTAAEFRQHANNDPRFGGFYSPIANRAFFHVEDVSGHAPPAGQAPKYPPMFLIALNHESGMQLLENLLRERPGEITPEAALAWPEYWVVEGLAGFCTGFRGAEGGRLDFGVPLQLPLARRLLAGNNWPSLATMAGLTREQFIGRSEEERSARFNVSAVAVHFFLRGEGGRHKAAFLAYLKEVMGRSAPADSFARHFRARPETFDQPLRAYAGSLGQPVATPGTRPAGG